MARKQKVIPAADLEPSTLEEWAQRGLLAQREVDRILRKKGIGRPGSSSESRQKFGQRQVKELGIRVLGLIAHLTPAQRARVLEQARKLNGV